MPRPLVDQLRARRGELVERGADVVDLVGDVVHPRPALGEEAADGRVVVGRRRAARRGSRRRERRPPRRPGPRRSRGARASRRRGARRSQRVVEVLDRDAEVVDAACDHDGDASGLPLGGAVQAAVERSAPNRRTGRVPMPATFALGSQRVVGRGAPSADRRDRPMAGSAATRRRPARPAPCRPSPTRATPGSRRRRAPSARRGRASPSRAARRRAGRACRGAWSAGATPPRRRGR